MRTIESLTYTMNVDQESVRLLRIFRAKRARADYEMVDIITDKDLEEARRLAEDFRKELRTWLRNEHPDLFP